MTNKVQKPVSPQPEQPATVPRRSAVLAALSLLTASMGLSLSDEAKGEITQDVTVNKAKTADKAFNAMDNYVRGRKVPPKPTGPTHPPTPTTGSKNQK
jgi:hypothetical protein